MKNNRKIFIDCGAHDGCSVRKFNDVIKNSEEFEIHCFEPNPLLKKYHPIENTTFHEKAVWTQDGDIDFYNFSTTGGSSLLVDKNKRNVEKTNRKNLHKYFGYPEKITVQSIDLSKWIKENFSSNDFIILKMDIEGAEYSILKKMFLDKSINMIDELWIEWHMTEKTEKKYYKNTMNFLKTRISKLSIKLIDWDAMHSPFLLETNCTEHVNFGKQ